MQDLAAEVAAGMTIHAERMRENLDLTHGALFSQRALTALVESGMTRDDAYRVVQENAQRAWDTGTEFRDLLAEAAPDLDLDAVFDYGAYLTHIPEIFERLEALRLSLGSARSRDPLHLRTEESMGRLGASLRQGGQGARRGRLRVRAEGGRRLPADALDLGQPR